MKSSKKVIKVVGSGITSLLLIAITLAPFVIRILLRVGIIAPEVNILTLIASFAPIISFFFALAAGACIMEDFLPALYDILPEKEEVCNAEKSSYSYDFTTDFALYRATGEVPEYK